MDQPTLQQIKDAYQKKGYAYFTGAKPYNLNIWGLRKQYGQIDHFDDLLGISYVDDKGVEKMIIHKATVDPGKYYLLNKLGNPKGTFILAPGQYRGCWQTGLHGKTQYPALVQRPGYRDFKGWRDDILNGQIDRKLDVNGHFFNDVLGLNMHRSNTSYAALVGEYSAGCQVRQYNSSHISIMNLIQKALLHFSDSFSYTLFDEEEVFPIAFSGSVTRSGTSVTSQKKWPEDYVNMR